MKTPRRTMDRAELLTEVRRLKKLIRTAALAARAQYRLIDKLAAANLRVDQLMHRLRKPE